MQWGEGVANAAQQQTHRCNEATYVDTLQLGKRLQKCMQTMSADEPPT